MMKITGGDPAKLNIWAAGAKPLFHKAGEDVVVRENNDTFYKQAFIDLSGGPVTLTSTGADPNRFSSFQIMDDHNVNFRLYGPLEPWFNQTWKPGDIEPVK